MDPLANLQDIHLPNDIHNWPLAPGWWLLVTVIIAITFLFWKKFAAKRQQSLLKRQAIAQLKADDNLTTEQSIAIIKWVGMHYFKRSDIAALHGDKLLVFLTDKLPAEQQAGFVQLAENALMQQYRKSVHSLYADELQQAALHWVNHAMFNEAKAKIAKSANNLGITPAKTEVAGND